jgi:hypothetical protein
MGAEGEHYLDMFWWIGVGIVVDDGISSSFPNGKHF